MYSDAKPVKPVSYSTSIARYPYSFVRYSFSTEWSCITFPAQPVRGDFVFPP